MENHFTRYSKVTLSVLIFILSLSLSFTTVYGQELQGHGSLQERLAQRGRDLKELGKRVKEVMKVQNRNRGLIKKFGVVGIGTGITPEGEAVIKVFTRPGITGIPKNLEGVRVTTKVTGNFYALRDDTNTCDVSDDEICEKWERWPLPVPIGVSVGHPLITAGTFGARVTDGTDVFILSNNHVLANINQANINDPILQPGSFDGGVNDDDAVARLAEFEQINFCQFWWFWLICNQTNTIDAAIALSTPDEIGFETATGQYGSEEGYGTPSSIIHPAYGDPVNSGDENLSFLLGQSVQKYGRTTGNTFGTIDAINATVNVCYDDGCNLVAQFVDQIIITPGSFSAGGDSGSLIVTNDENKNPVGLLFAGSDTQTIANRIDLVLNRFGVSIDEGVVDPVTDVAITSVSAPVSVVQGSTDNLVEVTLQNMGNQDVGSFDVTVSDETAASEIGTETVSDGLSAGGSTVLTFSWNVSLDATLGEHELGAYHSVTDDDDTTNDQGTTWATVVASLSDVAVTAVSAPTSVVQGSTGNLVEVTVKNMGNQDVGSFDVTLSDETATYEIGTETVSEGLNAGASTIVSFSWDLPLDAAVGEHQLLALHNLSDDVEGNDSETTMVEIVAQTSAGPYLWTRKISATTAGWETVNLDNDHDYGQNMVVICTPNYEYHALLTPEPLMAHVQNASGSSFQVKLVQAVGGSIQDVSTDVHCMVVEAGIYTLAEHGVKMEAVKFDSTITDGSGSWVGENRSYSNSYTNPVVVGQVMSLNSYDYTFGVDLWSAFWCRGSSSKNPPSSTILRVGKHDGEDPRTREPETIGYVVMEAGSGSIGSTSYVAGVSSDTIRGVGDKPPYYYPLDDITSPLTAVAILSQAAMDGGNGSWAILYGNDPITASGINLAVDEDMAIDYERRHTSEQVGYIVFE